jgi:hypothetical protein
MFFPHFVGDAYDRRQRGHDASSVSNVEMIS